MRRQVLVRLANAATMLAATALLLAAPARAQDDTIKVGLLMSYSGIGMLGGTSADNVI